MSTLVPVGEVRTFEKQTHLIDPMGEQTSVPWHAWYAVYTRSRFEQVVKKQLDFKGINSFLPLYSKISQWKDRRKVGFVAFVSRLSFCTDCCK